MKGLALLALAIAALLVWRCAPSSEDGLREGDLIFQANSGGDFVSAIEAVTRSSLEEMSFSHVGIIHFSEKNGEMSPYVLEATTNGGVVLTPLEDFLSSSAQGGGRPLVRVRRYPDPVLAEKAVQRALSHLGKGYDYAFAPGTESLYCSELVWECFLGEDGRPLFHSNPMTFKDSTGEVSPLWVEHYKRLGEDIPEGVPGTNPNDMFREPSLVDVKVEL